MHCKKKKKKFITLMHMPTIFVRPVNKFLEKMSLTGA